MLSSLKLLLLMQMLIFMTLLKLIFLMFVISNDKVPVVTE